MKHSIGYIVITEENGITFQWVAINRGAVHWTNTQCRFNSVEVQ